LRLEAQDRYMPSREKENLRTDYASNVYESVFDMLPSERNPSPVVRVRRLCPSDEFALYAKLEWENPFGSVKDRAAWYMLRALEEQRQVNEGRGVVEPTSGNTGISLAAMGSARGYRVRTVVPNGVPLEKKVLLKICGAELDVVSDAMCPAPGLGEGSINLAKTYARAQGQKYVMPNQYENEENVRAHYETTGPEIWRQTQGKITHLFVSLGTCGTVTGTGRFLKEKNPGVKVIAVQPSEGHDVPGLRNLGQLEVSKLFDRSLLDAILEIDYRLAYRRVLDLCRQEGLLAGPSAALVFEGAQRIVSRDKVGVGVMIFADNVFKYVSNMVKHIPELAEGTTA
jgi:cysteine synthase